jgi:hypothetical protein
MFVRSVSLAAVCALLAVIPLRAHHSHGNYDVAKWTTMEGTVKELHLLEATGPSGLLKVGIKREDVRPGDAIKVRCHLLRDGSNGCLLGFVTPMHGDMARGHGVEKDWDGDGGAGYSATTPVATPR